MKIASLPPNENERLHALYNYNILDTEDEKDFNELVNLASYICNTQLALISFVDSNRPMV